MAEPKFFNSNGSLTDYALSCGYREHAQAMGANIRKPYIQVVLWKEHECYHVRAHEHNGGRGRLSWDTFDKLGDARRAFRDACRKYKAT